MMYGLAVELAARPAQIDGRPEKSGLWKKESGAAAGGARHGGHHREGETLLPVVPKSQSVGAQSQANDRVESSTRKRNASPSPSPPSLSCPAHLQTLHLLDLLYLIPYNRSWIKSQPWRICLQRWGSLLLLHHRFKPSCVLSGPDSFISYPVPPTISDEGQELATLPPASTAGGSSFQASSEQSADSSPGEIDNTGSSSQEITEQMAPLRVFQNGASLFQGLVERARKTVRGSADDIGWLQQDQSLPPTEDGTARFLEILDAVSNHGPLYFVKTKSYFSKMGLACHIAKIHSESSVSKNAREIKEYIEEIYWGSKKRVLLLGHSKGGVDAAAALSLYWPQLKDKVAGLALAQSPYGGSPVASDILREGQLGDYVRLRKLMEILVSKVLKGDLQALEDLTYERRKEFLQQNPLPPEVPIVSFHTEASITPSVLTALSHVAHLELPAAADGNPTRIPVVMPLSAAMAACSQLLVARYGEKSDGLVTRKDAEVPGSVVVRPERKLDHAWMVYSSLKEEPRDQADTSQACGCWPANAKEETWPSQGALIFLI
uniref:Uncharacterized protein n=1 Tax=Oryza nivara TaxID=4536 RepID=A0A0E0IMY2_ORYNI